MSDRDSLNEMVFVRFHGDHLDPKPFGTVKKTQMFRKKPLQ